MHAQLILQIKTVKPGVEINCAEPITYRPSVGEGAPIVINGGDDDVIFVDETDADTQIIKQVSFLIFTFYNKVAEKLVKVLQFYTFINFD